MKKVFCFLAAVFIASSLFAAPKISEKQVESFIEHGNYIKIINFSSGIKLNVTYYTKESISKISIFDDYIDINGVQYKFEYYEISHENDNIIMTYRY